MDIADYAQIASAHFHQQATEHQQFDLAPVPPVKVGSEGEPLCVGCDDNIETRRQVVPSAIRCTECQHDFDIRNRR